LQVPSQGDVAAAAFTGARNLSEAPSNLKRGRHTKQARQSLIIGTLNEKVELSVAFQDLSRDEFIIHAPRMQIEGKAVPTLGGIPLLHKLGQGGMGAVYYGIHPGFKQEVAIKVLPFHLAQKNPDLINRFFREARIAANVHSQHLVRVTDVAQEAGISYLVMEYVTGKTAAHELKLHKVCGAIGLPERTALDICIASCQGLADAHRANIVHRDVKPDNILVPKIKGADTLDYQAAKLADLGLARNEDLNQSMTGSQMCMGTPGFMSPEQIEDTHHAGKAADVFSLGATLYALLCGDPPFVGDGPMQILRATQSAQHMPVRARRMDVSTSTATVIDLCLAKDASHRYEDGASLMKALKACRTGLTDPQSVQYFDINKPLRQREADQPVEASQFTLTIKPKKVPRRFWHAAAVAIVVLLGVVGYHVMPSAQKQVQPRAQGLPKLKDLDASEAAGDQAIIEKDRVRRQNLETMSTKLEEMKKAKQAEDLKQQQAVDAQRAEFENLLSQAQEAASRREWEQARGALAHALASPGAALSAKADEARAMAGAIRSELNKIEAETKYVELLEFMRKIIEPERMDEFGHCGALTTTLRNKLDSALVQARNIKPEAAELNAIAKKLALDAVLELSDGTKLELVLVPPGEFTMGYSHWEKGTGAEYEHTVNVTKPFYISKHAVTTAQFRRFTETERYSTEAEKGDVNFGKGTYGIKDGKRDWIQTANWRNPGFGQLETHPVVAVSWNDCQDYCKWLSRKNNRSFRLPTEAEWEFAARGPEGRQWPWGNIWSGGKCNHADRALKGVAVLSVNVADKLFSDEDDGFAYTSPAGAFDNASWCGARDMAGNVSQWCQDWYSEKYYAVSTPADPTGPQMGEYIAFNENRVQLACRSIRGGSFLENSDLMRSSARKRMPPSYRSIDLGFRIVMVK
jgi:serine/threonine-protein kinase